MGARLCKYPECYNGHNAKGYCDVHYWRLRNNYPMGAPFKVYNQPVDPARCGTPAQARLHRRRGEKPCEACRIAANQSWKEHRTARTTTCGRGHEFTPENTFYYANGRRNCRICAGKEPEELPTSGFFAMLAEVYGDELAE